jgi:hypothetical protein
MLSKLLLLFILVQFGLFAQETSAKKPTNINGKARVLYSNNFQSPAQWSFSNTSTPSANWLITTNLNVAPFPSFNPAGFFTAFNGYAIIDSDAQGDTAHQDAILSLNPRITACTNEPFVLLRFSQMYRKFNDTTSVEVSNNGTTWTEFVVNQGMFNSTNSANPEKVTVNISNVAGNQDTVYIRFRYRASDAWFWAVDDIEILRQDEFDLEAVELISGTTGNWGSKIAYTKLPVSQVQPIKVSGKVKNAGYSGQGDVKLVGASSGFSSESTPDIVPPNLSAVFNLNQDWTPTSSLGNKSLGLHVESTAVDAVPINNFYDSLKLEVTTDLYARDELIREGRVSNNFNSIGFEVGNVFDMFQDETLTSARVLVMGETAANSTLFVKIYEAIDNNTFNYLSGSDTLIIPALTQDTWYRVRMRNPELLETGKSYLLVAGSEGNPVFPGLVIGTSGLSESFTTFQKFNSLPNWYSFTEKPMVRMSFESVVSNEEIFSKDLDIQLFPNPASGSTFLRLNDVSQSDVIIQVSDMTGKIVLKKSLSNLEGTQTIELETGELNAGIYLVNIFVEGVKTTKKLTIK